MLHSGAGRAPSTFGAWSARKFVLCDPVDRTRGDPVPAVRRAGLALGVLALLVEATVLPPFDPAKSLAPAAAVARREAAGAAFSVAGTSDLSPLWSFGPEGFDRAGVLDDLPALARALAPDAPRAVVLVKGRFWTDRATLADPATAAALDRVRVLWERRVSGYTWHLLTNAPR